MFSLEQLNSNPDYVVEEKIRPEFHGLKCWYQGNLIFDRAVFTCPHECFKKQNKLFVALLEARLLELNLSF